ncbi:zinc finger protein basonuclin-1-like isoform X1 [Acipenser ruthenus]|uniref:zinc finger protein basonuclin-1-like isoform X1 n=2 Tax=Acipenser ruthenus TaxID=7906 RepID=UPI002740BCC6|nr:zinc finger protein basonuclin-1-like isoform X1 [Acipenser ruthenus]
MKMSEAICCTLLNCNCECFKPGKIKIRQCEHCRHGWVAHALSKLKVHHLYQGSQVEIVQSNVVFDISSLMLYGTQAIPVRLKILLDRLFSVLKQEEVIQILNALDWTLQDYIRGYVLQDATGKVLDRWAIMTYEEEIATLQQFLRFGETKSIVELMVIQDKEGQAVAVSNSRTDSDIRAFIESNSHRSPSLSANIEKVTSSNVHHFENFINSMAFMLPFQFLSPVPAAPVIGSSTDTFLLEQGQRQSHKTKQEVQIPATESSLLGSSSASVASDNERNWNSQQETATKVEAEEFPGSDEYSDAPSTPCNASVSSEVAQMSPETSMRSPDKHNGSGPRKGRVYCSACEKTFYDKGTLKIHYNAVHLKIKHKCTIQGCNMVFSSLRSRNRHSANPNPRLHMPMNRNHRDKDMRGHSSADVTPEVEKKLDFSASVPTDGRSVSTYIQSSFPNVGQSGILFPNLKTVQPVLPFYRSLVTPGELANTPDTLPSLPLISSSLPEQPVAELSSDPIPKKKSRKSSMPIKIEKEAVESVGELAEDDSSGDDVPLQIRGKGESASERFEKQTPHQGDSSVIQSTDRDISTASLHSHVDPKSNQDSNIAEEREDQLYHLRNGVKCVLEGSVISLTPEKNQKENNNLLKPVHMSNVESCAKKEPEIHPCDDDYVENEHRVQNRGFFQILTANKETAVNSADSVLMTCTAPHLICSNKEEAPHHCEICNKTFKNPYSVKMHYRNVHLKEMHMCTVEGCNAAFPSRRSRDRHSANMNLHHKLLTKDQYGTPSSLFPTPAPCRDLAKDFHPDILLKEHVAQTSVIFKGANRMGLVFPMSKSMESCFAPLGGSPMEEGAVLDLSTTSILKSGSSTHSSWDSDGGSEDGIPVEDSDESYEGLSLTPKEELHQNLALIEKASDCFTQHLPAGSPITCHMCQKVYSNKGTFRAHYKTVHLRQLHKCKIPDCNTMFSSVRSRNRHSQNPNLHRNMSSGTSNDQL